jgi:hypothetical protein
MEQKTTNQETDEERYRKMADANFVMTAEIFHLLDRVFGKITNPKISADKDTGSEVRISER